MKFKQVPVLLLTGYLGSGKTTLLNRILTNEKGIRFAVIVNDIGEVNIDADLIQKGGVVGQGDDSLVALQNGCICCTLKMDLIQQLTDLVNQGRFDYIVIEASGVCEPGPIAQTICSIPSVVTEEALKGGIPVLDCIITVVDALRMRDEFQSGESLTRQNLDEDDIENLIIQQVEFCNMILLNKASDVDREDLGRLKDIIRALQPKARIRECDYCDVPLDELINTRLFDFDDVATSATWIQKVEGDLDEDAEVDEHHHHHHDDDDDEDEHEHHHHHHGNAAKEAAANEGLSEGNRIRLGDDEHHHHHHHHHGHDADEIFDSVGVETINTYTEEEIREALNKLPENIVRAKGIVPTTDGGWLFFDFVPGDADIREGKPAYTGLITVIGEKVDIENVKELFRVK